MKINHDYDPDAALETVLEVVKEFDQDDLCRFLSECHPGEIVRVGTAVQRYDDETKTHETIA